MPATLANYSIDFQRGYFTLVSITMNYWMVKQEPEAYSWDDLVKDGATSWTGVRNFQARNNLRAMKKGDFVFFYHSNEDKAIIGISKIIKEGYPEPKDANWVAVDIAPDKKLKNSVSLAQIKADKRLANMVLVKASRLSVQPVKPEEFDLILALSETK